MCVWSVGERYEHTILFFQILPVEKSRKPQASHLQTRVEYLLKLVQSEAREHARKKVHSLVTGISGIHLLLAGVGVTVWFSRQLLEYQGTINLQEKAIS